MNEEMIHKAENQVKTAEPEKWQEVTPLADILEEDNAVTMWFEVPGANKDTISIQVNNGILEIKAESSLRRGGSRILFRREFQLSDRIDTSMIAAKTQDGILTLTLPKSERARVHKIPVC